MNGTLVSAGSHPRVLSLLASLSLALAASPLQADTITLGLTAVTQGAAAGRGSVGVAASSITVWNVGTSVRWLQPLAPVGAGNGTAVYAFDANPGPPRSGMVTVGTQTLTVTQAGNTYQAANPLTALVSVGVNGNPAYGLTVDGAGNVYFAVPYDGAVRKWNVTNGAITTLVSGLGYPTGVAVDSAGNVYCADLANNTVKRWTAANSNLTTLVSSGLDSPTGLAVDSAGNVYICDNGNNAVKRWNVVGGALGTLAGLTLNSPTGVAVDVAGNVYIADSYNSAIKRWDATSATVSIVISNLYYPQGVAVDGAGNVYAADTQHNAIKCWSLMANAEITLLAGVTEPQGVAVDARGNLYFSDLTSDTVKELPRAFLDPNGRWEAGGAGTDALPVLLPATESLTGPFAPTSDQAWLSIASATNGVVPLAFGANAGPARNAHVTVLGQSIPVFQAATATLGFTALAEGPAAGTDSVLLAVSSATNGWSAGANAAWLHLAATAGTGNSNLLFTFDANPGATRTGTLTIAGQTFTVTQAGATYVAANTAFTLVSSGLNAPNGLAVDTTGNLYVADTGNKAIKQWNLAGANLVTLVSTGLSAHCGVAVDGFGDVYISNSGSNFLQKWQAASSNLTVLVATNLNYPDGLAVNNAGAIYLADTTNNALKMWNPASGTLTALATGLANPNSVAVDVAGNLYVADNTALRKRDGGSGTVTTLVTTTTPTGTAVDGGGNVYYSDPTANAVMKWAAAGRVLTTFQGPGLSQPRSVAVDAAGNVYWVEAGANRIRELPRAFVDPTTKAEPATGGADVLPAVVPTTINLTGALAPASDQGWLTTRGITNGVITFSLTANAGAYRVGHITLLGQIITISQPAAAPVFSLGLTALTEGPAAGADSVALAIPGAWSASVDSPWLHLTTPGGAGSTNVVFTFDANPGATRVGTVTIAGQAVTVTQAGGTYAAANPWTTLIASGLNYPVGVAADGAGSVYVADRHNNALKRWNITNNTVAAMATNLTLIFGVACDPAGNVFATGQQIWKWNPANSNLATLVAANAAYVGIAVNSAGNVYYAENTSNQLHLWNPANTNGFTLIATGLTSPAGVATDGAGNVYFTEYSLNALDRWDALTGTITRVGVGVLNSPTGVAVDGSGNLYVADYASVRKCTAATGSYSVLGSFTAAEGVAVDALGNVYLSETTGNTVRELPRAFVDTAARFLPAAAGAAALPLVLPAGENLRVPFAPTSDQTWLTIRGFTNGVVSFAYTATASNRTAHVTILGQSVAFTQLATPPAFTGAALQPSHLLGLSFSNYSAGASVRVLTSTDPALPLANWTRLWTSTNTPVGLMQFTDTNQPGPQRFYRLTCP